MKFKKLLISASAIAAGSGLLATVLTSCSKAKVDDKLKIDLDDNGLLYKTGNLGDKYKLSYADAVKAALTRSSSWAQFKNVLADEIVYNWFINRMATSKDADDKNTNFRTSYDEWVYQIDKEYKDTVQTCKNKYGSNWEFYLQNEYLAPAGGTEETYKHAKLVDKIKADFTSKVFAKSYFGYRTESETAVYPHIYTKATKDINKNVLRNPTNWGNIGFFARAELSFDPGTEVPASYDKISPNWLAKHPEGDYAAIQDYVFNKWFETEKPMFVSAALFKYSNPKYVAGGKLDQIYDGVRTGVKVPTDKPSEAFPFFGADDAGSTRKAVDFLTDMASGKFATKYTPTEGGEAVDSNGTVTIPVADTDDSQTCLLVSGNQMFTALYTPYAMAVGNLYAQMIQGQSSADNVLTKAEVKENFEQYTGSIDDFAMLSNFFYKMGEGSDPTSLIPEGVENYLDLNAVYGGLSGTGADAVYHCPLFAKCDTYKHFYGDESATTGTKSGVRYITNNVQVNDFYFSGTEGEPEDVQPWVMELNEAGVHCLTIDGYNYVKGEDTATSAERLARLKKVVMYRLMQKQINDESAACISTDLLGESGKLKTYFTDNFTNIILELAMIGRTQGEFSKYNIFRTIESYKTEPASTVDTDLFLYNIWKDQKLSSAYANLTQYLNTIIDFEKIKKNATAFDTANNKIYSYRSKQVTNSKASESFSKTIFENGLLAPFVYEASENISNQIERDYSTVNRVVVQGYEDYVEGTTAAAGFNGKLESTLSTIEGLDFVKEAKATAINTDSGFSPQIATAKEKSSNRFWYKSGLVDKVMYAFMGNKAQTANAIKMNAYKYYVEQKDKDQWFSTRFNQDMVEDAFATTYAKSKLLTGDKNISNYISETELTDFDADDYYSTMNYAFNGDQNPNSVLAKAKIENGEHADDLLNYELLKATMMYLVGSEETGEKAKAFDNFYTVFNSKIGDDENAVIGYTTKGYTSTLSKEAITGLSEATPYDFDANVDNLFDQFGYSSPKDAPSETTDSKMSVSQYWTVANKTIGDDTRGLAGFTGLQTKASNSLDSASGLQGAVFDNLAKAIYDAKDLGTGAEHGQNDGCWFQFAGQKNSKGEELTFPDFKYGDVTVVCKDWFPTTGDNAQYGPVRKIAKKIIEYRTMDDLRTLAKTLANCYDGYTYFSAIADGTTRCDNTDDMKMKMLKLLPSVESAKPAHHTEWHAHDINTFQRISNTEVHTLENNPSYAFKDSKSKTSYRMLLTQINKADAIEKTLAPTWDGSKWVQGSSPITPEEFWILFFNVASESTVQQRAITEIVKTAFGDDKLIVYDAQLYNQFDSVWIKDWTKKTMGA